MILGVCKGAQGDMIYCGGSVKMLFVVFTGNVACDSMPVMLQLWEIVPWAYAWSCALLMASMFTTPALH